MGTHGGLPTPRIAAAPEGVYVFEGRGMDHLRLLDHEGNYLRAIYPPPARVLKKMVGLKWYTFPQGQTLPLKHDILQSTLLTSGPSGMVEKGASMFGSAATAIAVRNGRIALVHRRLNRLYKDGSTGGLELTGPVTCYQVELRLDGIRQRLYVNPAHRPAVRGRGPDHPSTRPSRTSWRSTRRRARSAR
ncbi:MAG: hypothetical protein B1H04_06385 [Planctomycetales bacterium 4484_123]|nr:MAG: hypothetical protein B1H04_06385 [Planctomycetales bacterium 4484_123]